MDERFAKRVIDVIGATLGLLILGGPLILLLGIVWAQDGAWPLFVQTRVGKDGRRFRMWKIRSMHVGAEALLPAVLPLNEVGGLAFKMREDPRVTPLGRWLRRSSLDELPQLVNVLAGDMSLVGPRPALPEEVCRYSAQDRRRLAVPSGMTGLWQVSGRCDLPFDQWIALDLHYVDHWSLWLDLVLLARTLPAVWSGAGAR